MPCCTIEDIARIMPTVEPRAQRQLGQIVLATQKLTKPMVVECVSGSVDGQGRYEVPYHHGNPVAIV